MALRSYGSFLTWLPVCTGVKHTYNAFISNHVRRLAQNCPVPFHGALGTVGLALLPSVIGLVQVSTAGCWEKRCYLFGDVDSSLGSFI